MIHSNRTFRAALLAAAALATAACAKDDAGFSGPEMPTAGGIVLRAEVEALTPEFVVSRAADKTEEESRINTLHVFIFGSDGEYLEPAAERREQAYQLLNANTVGSSVLMIDNEGFAEPEKARQARIYAVANVEAGTFGDIVNGRPRLIPNETALRNFYYTPSNSDERLMTLPDEGMPMFGMAVSQNSGIGLNDESGTDIDLTQPSGDITIRLRALMARIDVTIRIDSEHTDAASGTLPSLRLRSYAMRNMVTCVPFIEPMDPASESVLRPEEHGGITNGKGVVDAEGNYLTVIERSPQGDELRAIYNRSGNYEFSFYVFENLRQPDLSRFDPSMYPSDIEKNPDDKQRYKPLMADASATNFRFEGLYTTYNGSELADVSYALYLGANHTDNFEVGRNRLYVNDITIKGITTHDGIESGTSFDARVNVSTTANNYFISMLRERDFDAHFCVAPMDIYLYGADGDADGYRGPDYDRYTMEIELIDDATGAAPTWMRIERVAAADMADGGVSLDAETYLRHPNEPFVAGTGKRRFFTYDLLTAGALASADYTAYTGSRALKHRDRLYFYVDENVVDGVIQTADRSVTARLTYCEDGAAVGERIVTLVQHGLLPVRIDDGSTIYVEAYEEYLDHYDPLEPLYPENTLYDGLPWGAEGRDITGYDLDREAGLMDDPEVENYSQGRSGTLNILYSVSNGGIVGCDRVLGFFRAWTRGTQPMELDERPETAAEYCYRKNKTEADGTIDPGKAHWYLPAIRQLEYALTTYYSVYPEFQTEFYWSCAAACARESIVGAQVESPDYARATKATPNADGTFSHVPSGPDYEYDPDLGNASTGGRALRSQPLRIRAVYIP